MIFFTYLLVLLVMSRYIINFGHELQVTKLKCGGFTLGIALNHCMADGVSAMSFMNAWAEMARAKPLSLVPCHDRTILKSRVPPQIAGPYNEFVHVSDVSNMTALFEEQQLVYKSFHFDAEKLATVKRMAKKDQQVNFYLMRIDRWPLVSIFA